jgi:hypothetical protein
MKESTVKRATLVALLALCCLPSLWPPAVARAQDSKALRPPVQAGRDADREAEGWAGKVSIIFEHFGEPADPWQARMVETGEPSKSVKAEPEQTARGVWLRLRNDSPLAISLTTYSMYMGKCWGTETGKRLRVLCEGMEIEVRNAIDSFASAILPPGTSVLFSVPREHLASGLSVYLEYNYVKEGGAGKYEDYGSPHRAYFKGSETGKR